MISTIDRGTKCICTGCATRFYDLNKRPGVCPKCGQEVAQAVKATTRRPRRTSKTFEGIA